MSFLYLPRRSWRKRANNSDLGYRILAAGNNGIEHLTAACLATYVAVAYRRTVQRKQAALVRYAALSIFAGAKLIGIARASISKGGATL